MPPSSRPEVANPAPVAASKAGEKPEYRVEALSESFGQGWARILERNQTIRSGYIPRGRRWSVAGRFFGERFAATVAGERSLIVDGFALETRLEMER